MDGGALITLNDDSLIDRIADGAFLRDLAKESGIDKRRLSEQLRKHPNYTAAKEAAIEVQLDDAQVALKLAAESADIARAREMFRAAAWRAEREFPQRWGARTQITGDLQVTVHVSRGLTEGPVVATQLPQDSIAHNPVDPQSESDNQ